MPGPAADGAVRVSALSNGLTVITLRGGLGSTTAMLFVRAGSRSETRETAGCAHFLEHLFFKGTRRRPSTRDVATEIDALGCRCNGFTSKEYAGYYIKGAAEYVPRTSEILADMVANALVRAEDIDGERGVILSEQRTYEDNPSTLARTLTVRALYGDTPLGWDATGFPDVVATVTRETLLAYRNRFYLPSRMVFLVAGVADHGRVEALASEHLGRLADVAVEAPAVPPPGAPGNLFVERQTRQANLCLALPGPSYADSEREMALARLVHVVLGGSMSSRLFLNLRARQGLCYSVRSRLEPYSDVGAVTVFTATDPERTPAAVEAIVAEMRKLGGSGMEAEELERARAVLKGIYVIEREDTSTWARLAGFDLMHRGHVRLREDHFALLDSIALEEVNDAAARYLSGGELYCVLVGPTRVRQALDRAGVLPSDWWSGGTNEVRTP